MLHVKNGTSLYALSLSLLRSVSRLIGKEVMPEHLTGPANGTSLLSKVWRGRDPLRFLWNLYFGAVAGGASAKGVVDGIRFLMEVAQAFWGKSTDTVGVGSA